MTLGKLLHYMFCSLIGPCKRAQHCCATLRQSQNNRNIAIVCMEPQHCWHLLRMVWNRSNFGATSPKSQKQNDKFQNTVRKLLKSFQLIVTDCTVKVDQSFHTITVKSYFKALGLYNFIGVFGCAYKRNKKMFRNDEIKRISETN